jgi:hypothetical protein
MTIRIEPRDRNGKPNDIARDAVRFFWKPKYEWDEKAKAYPVRTDKTTPNTEWAKKRFALVEEPEDGNNSAAEGGAFLKMGTAPVADWYHAYSHTRLVPHPASMPAILKLMTEIGTAGRGRVFWLVEPGQPPEHAALVWQPDATTWGGAKIASPGWPESEPYTLEAFEPPGELLPADSADGRTGLVPLTYGTWEILRRCGRDGTVPVALGKEGVVIQTRADGNTVYEVHLLSRPPAPAGYAKPPLRTRGLEVDPPPAWTEPFGLDAFTATQGRHLVGLAVCSPDVWKKVRSAATDPPPHRKPLFADPELWACPPVK